MRKSSIAFVIRRPIAIVTILTATIGFAGGPSLEAADDLGIRVPDGFDVSLFADDELAHDIFSMTIDSHGRVVVAAPGYVRILEDTNGDGKADTVKQFADGPANGAQGLYFHGNDLLCVGDAGLIRYRDQDGDDKADGPPDVFLKMRTGEEHTSHAIRRGPDGWWYVIAGNEGRITKSYATSERSPIREPRDGALLRLSPNLSAGEVIADGYRNPYDFDFHSLGDPFVFDSDDERDVSLPWYRPTRVFHALPASNAGWVSKSWKHPDYFFDMPPVAGSCGRGSPTGVECYRHRQFPAKYRGALFVLDWTFGRVLALPLKANGSSFAAKPIDFVTSVGSFGFAPTDAAVGRDGSLYISVGGRGTRGGVYRITYSGPNDSAPAELPGDTPEQKLAACLNAPQPLCSWSRAEWMPLARELGAKAFQTAAENENLTAEARIRAIEIVTEMFDGFDEDALLRLSRTQPAAVRARAVWSHGRTDGDDPDTAIVARYLDDADPFVQRSALEAVLGADPDSDWQQLIPELASLLHARDRSIRQLAGRIAARLPEEFDAMMTSRLAKEDSRGRLTRALGRVERGTAIDEESLAVALSALDVATNTTAKLEALRVIQLALGDVGPREGIPAAFDGYHSRLELSKSERVLDPLRIRLAKLYPTRDNDVDHELLRVLAVLNTYNAGLLDRVLLDITSKSDPVEDIHRLLVTTRIPVDRTKQQQALIAGALVGLEAKIVSRGYRQDQHWDERIGELYKKQVQLDEMLAQSMVAQKGFGRPGHVLFMSEFPAEQVAPAIDAFVRSIMGDPNYQWTNNVVFAIGESEDLNHRELIRKQYDRHGVRSAVIMTLAEKPTEEDREKFIEGLQSSQIEVLTACLDAFEKLPPQKNAAEQVALVATLRRLGANPAEMKLRERVAKVLERVTGETFGFEFGEVGYRKQPLVVEKWADWLRRNFPEETARQEAAAAAEMDQLKSLLAKATWDGGDADRGRKIFEARSCAQCHGGRQALGPDLSGVASRFSREDLFAAIVVPDRDVSPRYQTTMIQTRDGKTFTGRVIYEAVDGIILRNAANQTFRIEPAEIEDRRALTTSLMPSGLLKGISPSDMADLYAYLRSLTNGVVASSTRGAE